MQDDDAEILAAARAGFLEEAQDMLRQYEQALLVLESDPADAEQLNAAFRAAHTIKGGAGMFGFEDVVRFTHVAETLLDALRDGRRPLDGDCMDALLQSRDQIELLLAQIDHGGETDPVVLGAANTLADRLRELMGEAPAGAAVKSAPPEAGAAMAAATGPAHWHLSLKFGNDALRNGLDPLAFLRYLGQLGEVHAVRLMHEDVPALENLDAEGCYLWIEARFESDKARSEIEGVFEFAMEDADIQILDPGSKPAQFEALVERRCGLNAEQRNRLYGIWREMGVAFELVETVVQPAPDQPPSVVPRIERRSEGEPRERGPDRRSGEAERRQGGRDRRAGDDTRFVRVRADKLDQLIDLIGELVIAGSGAQMVAHQGGDEAAMEATAQVMALMQDTRDAALGLRMVPVGETFARFHRVVRDVAKQLGKEIELVITGGDTEMDKSMVDAIADPLMHLVRNSMDHGLEMPEDREAAGKPRAGTIGLRAFHEAGSIVIEVRDDGRGLARERILNKAIERGLVEADAVLADAEIWQLIFQPGFSTAEQVTDLSGRGVGMDVVKRSIESLRGVISLHSEVGKGTCTQIRLPLTLAMIDGFLTMVGEVHYVLPLSVVSECIDVPGEVQKTEGRVSGTFDLRGEIVPWLDLAAFFCDEPDRSRRRSLVVVRQAQGRVGLVVDRLLGEHQTVIKPLAGIFKHVKALAGSTILGSGDVALVLDVNGLMESARRHSAKT